MSKLTISKSALAAMDYAIETSPIDDEAKAAAIAMSNDIVQTSMDINNTLKTQGTKAFFGTHYSNAELDVQGIVALVQHVLRQNGSVCGRNIEHTDLRDIAIASSMYTFEIVNAIGLLFADAGLRYQSQVVKNVLSTYGRSGKSQTKSGKPIVSRGLICKITLSSDEDKPRPCNKPRAKWYLISTPTNPQ